ncbi:MAG: hypothetical protein J4215_00430 [Candidatus Diapherotrites archaeon]|uniref:Uncharacterized protein n=1 Tax=Candidatus Iainarchaeum sp. TaxID=3101447 RepID=A0A8T4L117_9ARCH|nr:hypothetical protein [Candidatus Diapherotrites archaeon]
MGFLDFLKKKEGSTEESKASVSAAPQGKYSEVCSLCGKGNTEVKWAGQFWHRKCKRGASKLAHKMV